MNPSPPPHDPPPRRHTTFKGDVLRLVTGTGLAQIIGVLAAPILTRLYAPEAFGVAALFASLTGILGVLACMRYELSIVLPDNDREAANLLGVSLCFSVLITLLTVSIIVFAGPQVLQWVRMPELAPYLWLVPITVLIHGVFTALNYWNTRTKHFTRLSVARVTSAVASTSMALGAGFAGHATGGAMIAASVGGQAVATTVLGGQIWRDNGRFLVQSITWREIWVGFNRYQKFPIFSSWGALLNSASWQLPILMLGIFFSPMIVGFYALGFKIIQMPVGLIGNSISQVFFQQAIIARKNNTINILILKTFKKLLKFSVVPMLILTVAGKDFYILFFGEIWAEAGIYTQILSIWAILWFISSPLSTIVIVYEKQQKEIILSLLSLITRIVGISIGGVMGSPKISIAMFMISGLISYGYLIIIIFRLSAIDISDLKISVSNLFFSDFCFIIPLIFIKLISDNTLLIVLSSALILVAFIIVNRKELTFLGLK